MTKVDDLYEAAIDNYGLITAAEARAMGILDKELARYSKRGWLERRGHGLYRLARHVPHKLDPYAEAVALVGPGSVIWGESVLAMGDLASVNPGKVTVATPRRVRRKLPEWIEVIRLPKGARVGWYEDIPSQPIADAIRSCATSVMGERLAQAVNDARGAGLIRASEAEDLKRELSL